MQNNNRYSKNFEQVRGDSCPSSHSKMGTNSSSSSSRRLERLSRKDHKIDEMSNKIKGLRGKSAKAKDALEMATDPPFSREIMEELLLRKFMMAQFKIYDGT